MCLTGMRPTCRVFCMPLGTPSISHGKVSKWNTSSAVQSDAVFHGTRNFVADMLAWDMSKVTTVHRAFVTMATKTTNNGSSSLWMNGPLCWNAESCDPETLSALSCQCTCSDANESVHAGARDSPLDCNCLCESLCHQLIDDNGLVETMATAKTGKCQALEPSKLCHYIDKRCGGTGQCVPSPNVCSNMSTSTWRGKSTPGTSNKESSAVAVRPEKEELAQTHASGAVVH